MLRRRGFATIELDALSSWRPGRGGTAVAIRGAGDGAIDVVQPFVDEHAHIPVVVVLPELDAGGYATAIRAGARAAIGEGDSTAAYRLVFGAALDGRTCIPAGLMRALAKRVPPQPEAVAWLTADDMTRLRSLAGGWTVAALADHAGYSEREMFRMLNELYDTLGVANRTQAIIWAARHGVLDDAVPEPGRNNR